MKKNTFDPKRIRQDNKKYNAPKLNAGMAVEKLLAMLEKYILLDLLFMLLGLIHKSENGLRGYPFGWLGSDSSNEGMFLLSLAVITGVIIAVDIATKITINMTEPVTRAQRTHDQYASTYTEYEDPINGTPTESKYTGQSRTGNYERKLADDYDKIRKFIDSATSSGTSNSRTTATDSKGTNTIGKLLNGKTANTRDPKKNNTTGLVALLVVLTIFVSFLITGIGLFFDDDEYDWDNDLYDTEITDEDSIDDMSSLETICEGALYDLQTGDTTWLESIDGNVPEGFRDMADWDYMTYEKIFEASTDNGDLQDCVIRYRLTVGDEYYLAAFRFTDDELDEFSGISGFAVSKYPEYGDGSAAYDFGSEPYDGESVYFDDNDIDDFKKQIENNMITAGDCMLDGFSILIW